MAASANLPLAQVVQAVEPAAVQLAHRASHILQIDPSV